MEVFALAPDYDDFTRDAVRACGAIPVDISLERAGMSPSRDLADLFRLRAKLKQLGPDACFSYFAKPVIYGSLAARMASVPHRFALVAGLGYVFADGEGPQTLKARILRITVSQLYRLGLSVCQVVFFQNEEDRLLFVEEGLVPRDKTVRVNGTGVDLERLGVSPPAAGPTSFLLMARLLVEKGIREYATAAREVRRDYPEARFVLLGGVDPNPGGLSRAEVDQWVAEGVLEWPGHVNDVTPYLRDCSVFVLPSYYREGVPRSTQEAMAMGKAVITTDNVGCRETVNHGAQRPPRAGPRSRALADAMKATLERAHAGCGDGAGESPAGGREVRRSGDQRTNVGGDGDRGLRFRLS